MHATQTGGVYFVEGRPDGFQPMMPINSEIGDLFTGGQLKSLRDLKEQMAVIARNSGGNIVADFKYGQRSGASGSRSSCAATCCGTGRG